MKTALFAGFCALPLLYFPYLDHPASTPKWAFMAVFLPALMFHVKLKPSPIHWIAGAFFLWCLTTLLWAFPLTGLDRIFQLSIVAMAYLVGASLDEGQMKWAVRGFVLGMVLNAVPFGLQFFMDTGIQHAQEPAGMFFNRTFLGEASSLGAVMFWPLGLLTFASMAKGPILVLGFLLALKWKWLFLLVPLAFFFNWGNSFDVRVEMWTNSLVAFTDKPWGWGIGSFRSVYAMYHDAVFSSHVGIFSFDIRPRTAHNEYVTLLVETGIIGLGLFVWLILELVHGKSFVRPVVVVFALLCLFNFPLHVPATAVFGALCAGHLACSRQHLWLFSMVRRVGILSGKSRNGRPQGGGVVPAHEYSQYGFPVLHTDQVRDDDRPHDDPDDISKARRSGSERSPEKRPFRSGRPV